MYNTPKEFVQAVWPHAQEIERDYQIPALFIVAQGALESGWGKSAIGNNLFGIKAGKSWTGKRKLVKTTEILPNENYKFPVIHSITPTPSGKFKYIVEDWFRDYDIIEACLYDHAKVLMQPNFSHAIGIKDPYLYAQAIQDPKRCKGGCYATAENYPETIKAVVQTVKKYLPNEI